jgi:formate hydrogenlyase subunit 6/NADH:ubiquinone oxidoreductase subunit I
VEVCNFDAIVMSHEHEMSTYQRNGDRVDLPALLQVGRKFQRETGWIPPTVLEKRKKAAAAALAEQEPAAPVAASEASQESG